MMSNLLETIHGSRLYGLHDANSDYDYYKVIDNSGYTTQRISGSEDTVYITLNDFLRHVANGVPQALEALWSPKKTVEPKFRPLFYGLHPSTNETVMRYRRTITNFGMKYGGRTKTHYDRQSERTKKKLRIHAMRMTLNLNSFVQHGRFNPELDDSEAFHIKNLLSDFPTHDYESNLLRGLEQAQLGELNIPAFILGRMTL